MHRPMCPTSRESRAIRQAVRSGNRWPIKDLAHLLKRHDALPGAEFNGRPIHRFPPDYTPLCWPPNPHGTAFASETQRPGPEARREGSIPPRVVDRVAARHGFAMPADGLLRDWRGRLSPRPIGHSVAHARIFRSAHRLWHPKAQPWNQPPPTDDRQHARSRRVALDGPNSAYRKPATVAAISEQQRFAIPVNVDGGSTEEGSLRNPGSRASRPLIVEVRLFYDHSVWRCLSAGDRGRYIL